MHLGLPCGLSPCPADFDCQRMADEYRTAVRGVSRIWFGLTKASEFVNLRTVIVTAAVYWGFGSKLCLAANLSP